MKRINQLRFKAEGGRKEVDVLLHAQASSAEGHPNVVRYKDRCEDEEYVYIVMSLCDETLQERMQRGGVREEQARRTPGMANQHSEERLENPLQNAYRCFGSSYGVSR